MSNKVPDAVAKAIKKLVYEAADAEQYLSKSRTDSGRFLNNLVLRNDIGQTLAAYLPKDQIRHYIKDAVLNRYSKDKSFEARPDTEQITKLIEEKFSLSTTFIDGEDKVSLFKVRESAGGYVVVSDGTFLKWETALRRAMIYIASKPFGASTEKIDIFLMLFAQGKLIPPSELSLLERALKRASAEVHIF